MTHDDIECVTMGNEIAPAVQTMMNGQFSHFDVREVHTKVVKKTHHDCPGRR